MYIINFSKRKISLQLQYITVTLLPLSPISSEIKYTLKIMIK